MNALKRLKNASKRERDDHEIFLQTFEFFLYAAALELHEAKDPYGAMRLERFAEGMIKRVDKYIDRYDSEYTLTAMKRQCKDIGFEVQIK